MKNIFLLFFLFIFLNSIYSQNEKTSIINQMKIDVSYLASDKLKGRKTGSYGEKKAAKYIRDKFKSNGLIQKGEDGYFQYFETTLNSNPHYIEKNKKIKGINVIGLLDHQQKETIIIGAHYDHLGWGTYGSLHTGNKEIHNGADDNASGVSILLNLIQQLSSNKNYNYLFIAFSGEEEGLLGSSYYAKNPTISLNNVRFMLNFDMVGRLSDEKTLAINGVGTSVEWKNLINKSNTFNFKLITSDSGIGPSDHTSFYLQNIPAIHFFTGQHEDYHKPSDDIEKINFNGMYLILSYAENIINKSVEIDYFSFQETENDTTQTPKFNVTLGIMPDYLYNGQGLRIDGVSKGKTASIYKIKKGDIVIGFGEFEINNIMDYMKGLSLFNKGDSTIIKIRRNNLKKEIPIVFQ
ncbi:MAG: peptidase M28 [Flavobacteriales bacterium]|nr:peptidase M28 [Flavobacteriales bacterium]|tara:strand:- start:32579 stop:33799 length:1221 start_codon:yes stop_codon:yes gene_type:complete